MNALPTLIDAKPPCPVGFLTLILSVPTLLRASEKNAAYPWGMNLHRWIETPRDSLNGCAVARSRVEMPKIGAIYAYLSQEKGDPDDEGVTAFLPPLMRQWMPMVGADEKRMASLRPMAQELANATGQRITLVKFTVRTDIETIEPE